MKKKTKASKPVKKTAGKKPVKKPAPKPVKKAAPKKAVKKVATKKPVAKKATSARTTLTSTGSVRSASCVKTKTKKVAKPSVKKSTPKIQKAVVTTVLPAKFASQSRVTSSTMPAQAAVKAPKPPQSKHVKGSATAVDTSGRKRLNKEELKYFENLLNDKKETLIQELDYIEDNAMRLNSKDGAGDLSSHAYHLADHATETQDREQAFHLASREGRFLYYIEEALDRVRAGTFGICKKCGTLIPKARLEAVPTAKMCINCKSRQEHATEGESIMA